MALDFLPADDPRRPHLLGRLGIVLAWALDFDEAVEVAAQAGTAIAEAETKEAAAEYLSDAAYVCSQAGGIAQSWTLARQGLTWPRPDVAWARLVCFDYQGREAEDPDPPGACPSQYRTPGVGRPHPAVHSSPPLPDGGRLRSRQEATSTPNLMVRAFWGGEYALCAPLLEAEAREAESAGSRGGAARAWATVSYCQGALGRLGEARQSLETADALAARLGMPVPTTIYPRQVLSAVMDEGWEQLSATFSYLTSSERSGPGLGPWAWATPAGDPGGCPPGPREGGFRGTRSAGPMAGACGSVGAGVRRHGGEHHRRPLAPRAPRSRRRHRAGPAGENPPRRVRSPVAEARSTLGRLCALGERVDEAVRWFAEARRVLTEEGVRPLLAICDFDEALMYVRRGDAQATASGQSPVMESARKQFEAIGMTGWRSAGLTN